MTRLDIKKTKCNINRGAPKIWTLSSGKIDKYKYLARYEISSSGHCQMIEQAKLMYSLLVKALGKQTRKKVDVLKSW